MLVWRRSSKNILSSCVVNADIGINNVLGYPFNRTNLGPQFSRGDSLEDVPGSAGARAPAAAPASIVAAVRAGEASVGGTVRGHLMATRVLVARRVVGNGELEHPVEDSPGSPHRFGTRPGARPRTSDSACQYEGDRPPQLTSVRLNGYPGTTLCRLPDYAA